MDIESLRMYCLSFSHVTESLPFGPDTLVFKVGGKIFLLANLDDYTDFNVKANPDDALQQREAYDGIQLGYHMNKKHWNTISIHSDVPISKMKELIKNSYDLVYQGLSKKIKSSLTDDVR